jgi:hypothetical protein
MFSLTKNQLCLPSKTLQTASLLTPVILATWEAETRRIEAQGQQGQMVHDTPHLQNNHSKIVWKCGSSSRATSLQGKALSSNPNPINKTKQKPMTSFQELGVVVVRA